MEDVLLNYGPLGVMVIASAFAIRVLDARCSDIQEKRITELKLGYDALDKNTLALRALTDLITGKKR